MVAMLIHPGWLVHASRSTRAALLARYTPMELDPMSEAQVMAMMDAVDKADSAQFSREEVLDPKGWVLLNYLMDSRTGLGLDEAIRRGQAFAKAGADVVFIEAPESADEYRRIGDSVDAWLLANMVPTGRSPEIPQDDLKAWGFDIAIYPSAGMGVVCAALEQNFAWLKDHGSTIGSPVPAFNMARLHELVGFEDVWAFERQYVEVGNSSK